MSVNPEFRRNLWLELTPYRLAGMPAVLAAVFFLAYLMDGREFGGGVATAAVLLFILLAGLWGTRLASEAVVSEIRDHTWDGQRMSVTGPWAMTWGKLLGSTIYPWYGAIICLVAFAGAVEPPSRPLQMALLMGATALLAQALGLLASLMAIRKDRRYSRSQATVFFIAGIALTMPLISPISSDQATIEWYGAALDRLDFLLLSAGVFVAWAVTGIYRLMRTELQMKNAPWLWCAFLLYLSGYTAGFINADEGAGSERLLFAFGLLLATTYGLAFSERKDSVTLHRLLADFQGRRWRHFAESCPLWLATVPFVLASGGLLLVSGYREVDRMAFAAFVLALICLMVRDLGLLLFLNLGRNPRRADWLMLLCLVLLYWVVPQILIALDFNLLSGFFLPRWNLPPSLILGAALAEAWVVGWLLIQRWRTAVNAVNA